MNNQSNIPKVYHGKWKVPQYDSWRNIIGYQECMGTLTCDGTKNTLEVYHEPKYGKISEMYAYHEVIFGREANGYVFTLFEAEMDHEYNFSKSTFNVKMVLVDREVKSLDEPVYHECRIRFPYLKEWAYQSRISLKESKENIAITLDTNNVRTLFKVDIDDNTTLSLYQFFNIYTTRYELNITQDTQLYINSKTKMSIRKHMEYATIFNEFLSIALFGKQSPSIVEFKDKDDKHVITGKLLYELEPSVKPSGNPLIDFEKNKSRLDFFIKNWFANYEQMAPICDYLIETMHPKAFDVPNFLMIAQSLDGYHKRFVNKKDGKDIKQYEHQIQKLQEHFEGVNVLAKCKLDALVLAHTRNKYSHLIPDSDTCHIEKAVGSGDLKTLTQKALILLVCCILDNIGMTIEEINICLNEHYLDRIASDIEFHEYTPEYGNQGEEL